jgi:hypothetical protein
MKREAINRNKRQRRHQTEGPTARRARLQAISTVPTPGGSDSSGPQGDAGTRETGARGQGSGDAGATATGDRSLTELVLGYVVLVSSYCDYLEGRANRGISMSNDERKFYAAARFQGRQILDGIRDR